MSAAPGEQPSAVGVRPSASTTTTPEQLLEGPAPSDATTLLPPDATPETRTLVEFARSFFILKILLKMHFLHNM